MNKFLTHNGEFTVTSAKTKAWRHFRINTAIHGPLKGKRILYLQNDDYDFDGIGFLEGDRLSLWKKKQDPTHQALAKMLRNLDRHIERGDVWVDAEFLCRCRVCNRTLTNPESIAAGIGPECAQR